MSRAWAALGVLFAAVATAGAISDNAGTRNGAFLKIATDARSVALSDVVVTMPQGVDSLRSNPAGLGSLESREAAGTHVEYYQGIRLEHVAIAYPMEESALAASALYLSPGDLDGRDVLGNPTGDFKFYDLVGTLGYGRKMLTRAEGAEVSVGLAVKIVQEKIAEQQWQNPAGDVGVLIAPNEKLSIGATGRNLSSSKADFPREIIGGAAYRLFRPLTAAVAANYSNDAPIRFTVGGEYRLPELDSAIRVAYRTHDDVDASEDSAIPFLRKGALAGLTMGAGFNYRPPMVPTLGLQLDYGLAPFGALGIAHTITVKARW